MLLVLFYRSLYKLPTNRIYLQTSSLAWTRSRQSSQHSGIIIIQRTQKRSSCGSRASFNSTNLFQAMESCLQAHSGWRVSFLFPPSLSSFFLFFPHYFKPPFPSPPLPSLRVAAFKTNLSTSSPPPFIQKISRLRQSRSKDKTASRCAGWSRLYLARPSSLFRHLSSKTPCSPQGSHQWFQDPPRYQVHTSFGIPFRPAYSSWWLACCSPFYRG